MFIFVKIIILMSKCIAKSEVIAWQSRGHGFEPRYNLFISFFRAFSFSQAAFTNSAALAIIRQNVSSAETPATHFLA